MASTPVFSSVAQAAWASLTAANTAKDGTGAVATVFTADAAAGSDLQKLIFRPRGTNVGSVARVFLNNGLSNATAANNSLIAEVGLPATTLTETAANAGAELALNLNLAPGHAILVVLGTAVAAGWQVTGVGGALT